MRPGSRLVAAESSRVVSDRADVLASLARAIAAHADLDPLPLRLCQACVDILGAAGGAITLAYTRPERVTLCATDAVAARLEDLQDVLGQGPGRDAFDGGRAVSTVLDRTEARWPLFAETARVSLGDLMVQALPIRPDSEVLGVLTVHRPPSAFAHPLDGQAQFLADAIGAALLGDPDARPEVTLGPWTGRARIHQATGMVVAQLKISPEDALVLLRAHAFAHGTTLDDVAEQITRFRLDFRRADDAEREQS
jgi:hypothetical protein